MSELRLLPMAIRDLDEVLAIEQRAHIAPWTQVQFMDSLNAGHWAYTLRVLGAEDAPDTLVGYCVMMPGVDEISLLNIAIDPIHQRQGWAKKILLVMEDQATAKNFQKIFLEVRTSNTPAIGLYQRMNYQQVGSRKAYYPMHEGQREDALVMMKELLRS
jgi:ribosomal-protein-alanine N-acetyltransferase